MLQVQMVMREKPFRNKNREKLSLKKPRLKAKNIKKSLLKSRPRKKRLDPELKLKKLRIN
jgi:hypothetical protein